MRVHIALALFLAGCTYGPKVATIETVPVAPPVIVKIAVPVPEKKMEPKKAEKIEMVKPCTDMDTGDIMESIRMKLDCIEKEI